MNWKNKDVKVGSSVRHILYARLDSLDDYAKKCTIPKAVEETVQFIDDTKTALNVIYPEWKREYESGEFDK